MKKIIKINILSCSKSQRIKLKAAQGEACLMCKGKVFHNLKPNTTKAQTLQTYTWFTWRSWAADLRDRDGVWM